jgi:phage repressor protein C with HTH and peptisase S24 domain
LQDGPAPFRVELGERIRWLLDLFDSRVDAAEIAGVTPEHLASYIGGRAKPPFELLSRLARAKGVSLDWIATGDGAPELGGSESGFAVVEIAQTDSSSGHGSYPLGDEIRDPVAFSRAWLRSVIRVPENKLCVVFNRGLANEPNIKDGDIMLVETGIERVTADGFYIFKNDGMLMTKLVEIYVDGRVALKTVDPRNKPQDFPPEEAGARVFGRVRWRGGVL